MMQKIICPVLFFIGILFIGGIAVEVKEEALANVLEKRVEELRDEGEKKNCLGEGRILRRPGYHDEDEEVIYDTNTTANGSLGKNLFIAILVTSIGIPFLIGICMCGCRQSGSNFLERPVGESVGLAAMASVSNIAGNRIKKMASFRAEMAPKQFADCENKYNAVSCMICYEDFTPDSTVYQLKCYHLFHQQCFELWIKDKNNEENVDMSKFCPQCKADVI